MAVGVGGGLGAEGVRGVDDGVGIFVGGCGVDVGVGVGVDGGFGVGVDVGVLGCGLGWWWCVGGGADVDLVKW